MNPDPFMIFRGKTLREISDCVRQNGRTRASEILGIPKTTIFDLLKKYPLKPESFEAEQVRYENLEVSLNKRLWEAWEKSNTDAIRRAENNRNQTIGVNSIAPIGIVCTSDMHLGGGGIDVESVLHVREVVNRCENLYLIDAGDMIDNHICIPDAMMQQELKPGYQYGLIEEYLGGFKEGKVKAVVPGNHVLWTRAKTGVDKLKDYCLTNHIRYSEHVMELEFWVNDIVYNIVLLHRGWGRSSKNPTNALKNQLFHNYPHADIIIMGHTHLGESLTTCYDKQFKYLVLPGSPKVNDDYGDSRGYAAPIAYFPVLVLDHQNKEIFILQNVDTYEKLMNRF
jgi:hypothetical protein